jgi:hypothetical protein
MVALEGEEPVGVLIGTKRSDEVLVLRIGVRPGHGRRGHGAHLATSLSQKLAVLGPPRLATEVPAGNLAARAFFAALGYREEAVLTDYHRPAAAPWPVAAVPPGLVVPAGFDDLAPQLVDGVAWERQAATLGNRREHLRGWAIATSEQIEAWVLAEPPEPGTEPAARALTVWATGGRDRSPRPALLAATLRQAAEDTGGDLLLPRLAAGELPDALLNSCGFTTGARYHRLTVTARPL